MKRSGLIIVITLLACIAAGTSEFTSHDAREAQRKYVKTLDDARATYISSLERAMEQAARAKDTNEIPRIAAEITRVKAIADDDAASGAQHFFIKSELDDVTVRFMHSNGSEFLQLKKDGTISPTEESEFYWRVVDGALEFLGKDGKTVTTRWLRAFDSGGYTYACARFIPNSSLPNVLAFEKPKAK